MFKILYRFMIVDSLLPLCQPGVGHRRATGASSHQQVADGALVLSFFPGLKTAQRILLVLVCKHFCYGLIPIKMELLICLCSYFCLFVII